MGTKADLEIMGLIAREMGAAATLGPWTSEAVFEEIRGAVRGYPDSQSGAGSPAGETACPTFSAVRSDHNGLFASGTLGRYSKILNSVLESRSSR